MTSRAPERRGRATRRRERGVVLPITALVLIPLMILAALAVDVGGYYAQTSRLQRIADAAALAGVVWMPNSSKATTEATASLRSNGITNTADYTITPRGQNQLVVSVRENGQQFFSSVVGASSPRFTRSATAEYVLPVPLAARSNTLGNQSTSDNKNYWASISGPFASYFNGDPYSTKCTGTSGGTTSCNPTSSNTNVEYRNTGYLYVVDVPQSAVGQSLTVQIFDPANWPRSNYANTDTADTGTVNTMYELFRGDNTPLDTTDNLLSTNSSAGRCTSGPGRKYFANNPSDTSARNNWYTLCTITVTSTTWGQWFLQVKSSNLRDDSGNAVTDSGDGWNQYALRATLSGGTNPRLYGYQDVSLFNNMPNQSGNLTMTIDLADIQAIHAGKTFIISLFDPGDGASGTYDLNILPPTGSVACTYGVRGGSTTTSSNCQGIITRNPSNNPANQYNGQWLDFQVQIPSTYTCTTNCWWTVRYDFANVSNGNSPNDRTVWAARVIGDPVHLIE